MIKTRYLCNQFNGLKNALLVCLVAVSSLAGTVFADTSVWVATQGDEKIYLGGTVHLLRDSDYPLPEEFETAYQDSQRLFFETDINAMNDLSVQAEMMAQLSYSDGRTLSSVLSKETYTALSEYAAAAGMPIMMLDGFKPGMVVSMLQVMEFMQMGFTPQGVDVFFSSRASADSKELGQLESVQDQINFISDMGEGNENEFIMMSLADLEETDTMMEDLIGAWRTGNLDVLAELFVNDMREQSEALYDSLLLTRNNNWLPIIERMFTEDGTEFVLVGAAHLVGEDGLLTLLEKKGYEISQL